MRRELKNKIAYLKLGPTDYIYYFDKEVSFLPFNSKQEKIPELYIAGTTIAVS